jgi:crossover junction endodeoxyribonuclease RuvC
MEDANTHTQPVILGIDPGTNIMGYGIITARTARQADLLAIGVLDLHRIADPYRKMKMIFDRTLSLIDQYRPAALAIEAPFYGKNVQSMLKLGRAQGTAIAAALSRGLDVHEYAPRKIKMAITGQGNASKEQVALMLQRMFSLPAIPDNLDATDGLAAAVCHFFEPALPLAEARKGKTSALGKSSGASASWKTFVNANPKRVKE